MAQTMQQARLQQPKTNARNVDQPFDRYPAQGTHSPPCLPGIRFFRCYPERLLVVKQEGAPARLRAAGPAPLAMRHETLLLGIAPCNAC